MSLWRYKLMTWVGGRLRRAGEWLLREADFDPPRHEIERIDRLLRERGQVTIGPPPRAYGCQHMQIQGPFTGPPVCAFCGTVMRPAASATVTVTTA
jgi:hypothetical protein